VPMPAVVNLFRLLDKHPELLRVWREPGDVPMPLFRMRVCVRCRTGTVSLTSPGRSFGPR
jgi:hypothetical protein